ncbi:MAG: glycosyltransferase family 4 protein [archaeon]
MNKKKLVIATDNYLPRWDGISRFLSEITPRLAKKYDITIIAPDFGKTKNDDFKVVKIPVNKLVIGDFQPAKIQYKKIKNIVKDADAVFTQTIGPIGISAIIAAKKKSVPLVSFIHSLEWELFPKSVSTPLLRKFLYPISKLFVRYIYNKCDLLITPSSNVSDMLNWQKIRTSKKIAHLGVDITKFKKGDKIVAKKMAGFEPNDFVIGYHGRLGREKDLKTLLRAFIRLRRHHKNVKLLIVGSGVKSIEQLFQNKENIVYPGPKNDVVPWINAMDVFVLPSLTETSSLSTLEAMSCEVPVIATKVGFVANYIDNNVNGMFFALQHPYALAKKIQILMEDRALRNKLGINGRKTILEKFSWEISADRIVEHINSVIEK